MQGDTQRNQGSQPLVINDDSPYRLPKMTDMDNLFRLSVPILLWIFILVGGLVCYFGTFWFKYCFWKIGPWTVEGGQIRSTHNDYTIKMLKEDVCGDNNSPISAEMHVCCPHSCTYLHDNLHAGYYVIGFGVPFGICAFLVLIILVQILMGKRTKAKPKALVFYLSMAITVGCNFACFFIFLYTSDFCHYHDTYGRETWTNPDDGREWPGRCLMPKHNINDECLEIIYHHITPNPKYPKADREKITECLEEAGHYGKGDELWYSPTNCSVQPGYYFAMVQLAVNTVAFLYTAISVLPYWKRFES